MGLFIDRSEQRLRTIWRVILFFMLYLFGNVLFGMVMGALAVAVVFADGSLSPEVMGDPMLMQQLITEKITSMPLMMVANAVFNLIWIVLLVLFFARFIDKRKLSGFGLRLSGKWWTELLIGLVLGAVLMVFIFLVELAAGWITITGTFVSPEGTPFIVGILGMAIVFLCVGIYEELMTRGYLLVNFAEGIHKLRVSPKIAVILALLISSVLFGFLHLGNPNTTWVSTLNLSIAGIFLGLAMVLTKRIAMPIGLHITWNFFQGNVFGFPVSGTGRTTTVIGIQQSGPDVWTGGAFGPEAGLIGLLAMIIGMLLIVVITKALNKEAGIKESLAIYEPRIPLMVTEPAVPVDERPAG